MMELPLFDDYVLREVTPAEFGPFFREHRPRVFEAGITLPVEEWLTAAERDSQQALARRLRESYMLSAFIMKGDTIIGWHTGRQADGETYYMANTAVLPGYRGRGVYRALVAALTEHLRSVGFQKLTSRHTASNNAILTLKLRAGFQITGMEVDERFGILVSMSYIFNDMRRKAYRFRVGTERAGEELGRFL